MPVSAQRLPTLLFSTVACFACTAPADDDTPPSTPSPTQVVVCHDGESTAVDADAVPAHLAHGDTEGACPEQRADAGTTGDAGSALDAGTPDSGLADAGEAPAFIDVLSDAPSFAIVGVEYRYRPHVETNRGLPAVSIVQAPAGAVIDDGQLRWTPVDTSTATFLLVLESDEVVVEHPFTVEVATPRPLATQTIQWRRGGTIVVADTQTELDGVRLTIAPHALPQDTEVTIAWLDGPTEPALPNHEFATRPFVVLPELPGRTLTIEVPVPTNVDLQQDRRAFLQTSNRHPVADGRGRGRYQDAVVLLDDLRPDERRTVTSQLEFSATQTRLVSSRYLRLAANRTRLYWNLAPGAAPPTTDAEQLVDIAELAIDQIDGPMGCTLTASVSVFVVAFTGAADGLAQPGAFLVKPDIRMASEAEQRMIVAHEMFHVAQYAMLPGWSYSPTQSWWAEAMATFGADAVFDDDTYATEYPWTESVVTDGWIGLPHAPQAYQLVTLFKHLAATRSFDTCDFLSRRSTELAINDFTSAIESETRVPAVETLADFTAVYSVYRRAALMDDVAALQFRFTAQRDVVGPEPLRIDFRRVFGGQAQVIRPESTEAITIRARHLSNVGHDSILRFYQEKDGALEVLAQLDEEETTFEVTGEFAVVVASKGLSQEFSRGVELIESHRVNGVVHDIDGRPVRAHVTLVEDGTIEDHSSIRDGSFGLDEIDPTTTTVNVRATCASDPSLVATAEASFDMETTVNVGTMMLAGVCPSIEITEPTDGTIVGYGPYVVRGTTNLPYDRLSARLNGAARQRITVMTQATAEPGIRSFTGHFADNTIDEGEHYLEVYWERPDTNALRVDFEKRLPRTWGHLSRISSGDECSNACPRVIISNDPLTVARALRACIATDVSICSNFLAPNSCETDVRGIGSIIMTGNGSRFQQYEYSMVCAFGGCPIGVPCEGPNDDEVRDAVSGTWMDPSSEPQYDGGRIVEQYDCRDTIGRASVGPGACAPGFDAFCPAEIGDCRFCGDGECGAFEFDTCVADCGTCGDGICSREGLENALTCVADCTSCGDGFCSDPLEDVDNCAQDCGCGNGVCEFRELVAGDCPADCGS